MSNFSDIFHRPCVFLAGAQHFSHLPPCSLPEVAFIGRSNVGKSSLINGLIYRKTLARVSHTPGRTTQINFFCLDKHFYLVDLPGYGYAEVSKKVKAEWQDLIEFYLKERLTLKRVYILIDSRRGIGDKDKLMMKFLDVYAISYQIVLTKIDQLKESAKQEVQEKTLETLRHHLAAHPQIIMTSVQDKKTLEALRVAIAEEVLK